MSPIVEKNCPCDACFTDRERTGPHGTFAGNIANRSTRRCRPLQRALEKVADSGSSSLIVDLIDENNKWRFAPGVSGARHFWSTDGIECLWCARQRTPAEIAVWFAAGKPQENCR